MRSCAFGVWCGAQHPVWTILHIFGYYEIQLLIRSAELKETGILVLDNLKACVHENMGPSV
jgi:hypothetical protein